MCVTGPEADSLNRTTMAAPTLGIAPISSLASLPNASPNLMPFHIDHNGPAPISTYFLVEAAKEHVAQPPPPPVVEMEVEDATLKPAAEMEDALPETAEPPPDNSLARRVTEATTRFIATFRGRIVQGLKVDLPSGYAGVIMTGESASAGKAGGLKTKIKRVVKAKKTARATRSGTRADDEDDEMDHDDSETSELKNARTLMPTAQFSSFVLWHPDIPVDPGRDEYLRSLTEWIRLANEIHHVEG
ncbi:ribonuclease H2, subunit C [Mycena alexandri]|uniref:Ribonuclease H2, subunit C n=1 Tax=Mycena alexandri TaxID=1745969 RepID=A0AAD6SWT2_9AGAR|nr:ribonuclease H2, subunit C [Mycena alexandri]